MGILYVDGHANQFDLFRVPQAFRKVFGGEVSSTAMTFKNPEDPELAEYFCLKLDVEEFHDMDSFTKLKIERVLKNINNDSSFFKEINLLKTTPDLDYLFSLHEQSGTPVKNHSSQTSMKQELNDIRDVDPSPVSTKTATTTESVSTPPDDDQLSDLSDKEDNLPKFK